MNTNLVNDRENTLELYLHLIPRVGIVTESPADRQLLSRNEAIVHILKCVEIDRPFVHWQITAKCVLLSLWMDERVSEKVKKSIEENISDATLPNYDYLLKQIV